jgi:hypothetical protein
MDLARFRVGHGHRALEDKQYLISGKDSSEGLGVPKPLTRGQPEHELVDLVGRHVDPVVH